MEAALLDFILDITASLGTHIAQHLREDELERIVANGTSLGLARRRHRVETVVGDVERGAKAMAALFRGIAIDALEPPHVVLGAQYAGDDDLVERYLLDSQRIEEASADVLQQVAGTWHKVRDAAVHARVNLKIRIRAHVEEFALAALCIRPTLDWRDAIGLCRHDLYVLHIRETIAIRRDATYGMTLAEIETR